MKDWTTKQWQAAARYKLQIAIFVLSSVAVFALAWQTSVANIDLSKLDKWQWINLWIGIVGLWTNNIISLLYKMQSRVDEGKPPMGDGTTAIIKKQLENG